MFGSITDPARAVIVERSVEPVRNTRRTSEPSTCSARCWWHRPQSHCSAS